MIDWRVFQAHGRFTTHEQLIADYRAATAGFVEVGDPRIRSMDRSALDAGAQWREPELASTEVRFHVHGITRPEAENVLDSFLVVRKYEELDHGEFAPSGSFSNAATRLLPPWRRASTTAPSSIHHRATARDTRRGGK